MHRRRSNERRLLSYPIGGDGGERGELAGGRLLTRLGFGYVTRTI